MNFSLISLVANYERKMVNRSVAFGLLAFLLLVGILSFHVFAHSDWQIASYAFRSDIPSAIPYTNAYLFCVFQAFLAIFIAGDFIKREPLKNSNEALLTRPVGNVEYVLGKGLAIVELLGLLAIVLMVLTGLLHVFITEAVFSPFLYVFYFFTLTLPSILFTTALIVCVKMFVRSQAFALLLLLFYLWASLTLLPFFAHGVADFTASRVPNIFSSIGGHPGMGSYLLQRLVFVWFALGLSALSVLGYRRLSGKWRHAGRVIAICFVASVVTSFVYLFPFVLQSEQRERYRVVYRQHDNTTKVNTVRHDITFHQEGKRLSSTSRLLIENRNAVPVDTVLFYLNPGLELSSLRIDGKEVSFEREDQVIVVPFKLQPGDRLRVTMRYSGTIDPFICYPEIGDKEFNAMDFSNMLCLGNRFYFLTDAFTLLTPESIWYPTTIPVVNVGFPWISRRDYTLYTLNVVDPVQKTVLSQGEKTERGDTICFDNGRNLFGIVLVMGDMDREQFQAPDFLSEYYYPRGEIPCQGKFLVSEEGKKRSIERIRWTFVDYDSYPYSKIGLVEVPVSFYTFIRSWREGTDYIHPELFLVPERRTSRLTDYKDLLNKKIRKHLAELPADVPAYMKDDLIESTKNTPLAEVESDLVVRNFEVFYKAVPDRAFFSWLSFMKKDQDRTSVTADSWNKYDYSFMRKEGTVLFSSFRYPMINSFFKVIATGKSYFDDDLFTQITKSMRAVEFLSGNSLEQAFQPDGVTSEMKSIIYVKGKELRDRLQSLVGDSLFRFIDDFRESHAYKEVDFDVFCNALNQQFGVDINPVLNRWYTSKGVPVFVFRDIEIKEDFEKEKATLSFKVWNKSDVEGMISVNYYADATGRNGMGRDTSEYITIAPHVCLEVALLVPYVGINNFSIHTGFARNLPNSYAIFNRGKVWVDQDMIREIDTTYFAPPTNEIIVDNEDEGFVIREERSSRFEKKGKSKKYNFYPPNRSEWRWTLFVASDAYGDVVQSFYSKAGGSGKSQVEWNAPIKEAGTYELFVKRVALHGNGVILKDAETTEYSFFHDGIEDKIYFSPDDLLRRKNEFTVKLRRANGAEEEIKLSHVGQDYTSEFLKGWIFSGRYELSPGDVKFMLQDKGLLPGEVLAADAVKWVKVE